MIIVQNQRKCYFNSKRFFLERKSNPAGEPKMCGTPFEDDIEYFRDPITKRLSFGLWGAEMMRRMERKKRSLFEKIKDYINQIRRT
jgi:hypothetical protein